MCALGPPHIPGNCPSPPGSLHVHVQRQKCAACSFEAEHGTEECPHPVDPDAHTCWDREKAAKVRSEVLPLIITKSAVIEIIETVFAEYHTDCDGDV